MDIITNMGALGEAISVFYIALITHDVPKEVATTLATELIRLSIDIGKKNQQEEV